MLNPAFQSIKSSLKNQINLDNPEEISISLDGWSQYHSSYLGINAHYIDKEWKRKMINIACIPFNESHTSENIWCCLKTCLNDWDILPKVKIAFLNFLLGF